MLQVCRIYLLFEINFFSCVIAESAEQSEKLKQSLKDEKHTRKRLESKLDHLEEELNDLKHEKESLERVRIKRSVAS